MILRGLEHCQDDDVIFISDLDEIPSADAVRRIQSYLSQFKNLPVRKRARIDHSKLVCALDMRLFMYSMNLENLAGWYGGAKAAPYWLVCLEGGWGIKTYHHHHSSMHKIPNGGWHFNTMGGKDRSLYKWLFTGPIYYQGTEKALLELGEHPELLEQSYRGQVASNTVIVPIDDTYPRYFLDHMGYFREIGWIYE